MLWRTPRKDLLELPEYDRIVIYLYRRLTRKFTSRNFPKEIPFDLDHVRKAISEARKARIIPRIIKNPADIKYTYDARRRLPKEIEQLGPITWLQVKKGQYKFRRTRRYNLIKLPQALRRKPILRKVWDQTPPFISELLGDDEQASFTRVRNAHLISYFLGFPAWQIQGHQRTSVSYGQIEIDEVHAGLDDTKLVIVPISGKGGQDMLSWSQALNLNTFGKEKAAMPGMKVRSLGLWRDAQRYTWLIEFSPEVEIDKIRIVKARKYQFVQSNKTK